MIKIIDDWYVVAETNPVNYVVRKGKGEIRKGKGYRDPALAYCGSLAGAIKWIRKQVIASELSEATQTLPEALQTIRELDTKFEKALA